MAKVIIKKDVEINGVNRLFAGDKVAFVNDVCELGNFVVTTTNNAENKSFASGVIAIKLDTMQPVIIEYRTIWGVASLPIDVNGVVTRTPQCLHDTGMTIFRGGSKEIMQNEVYTVGEVYACEFNRKDRTKGRFQWDIIGLDDNKNKVVIKDGNISFNGVSKKVEDVKNAVSEMLKRYSERMAEYDW